MRQILQIIMGTIGTLGFSILFNCRGKRLLAAAFGGFLSWSMFILLSFVIKNDGINYFIVASLTTLYAEVMARVLKSPTTSFINPALIPLIPGGSLYYTMAYMLSDSTKFLDKGLYTLLLASALALGTITATTLTRSFFAYRNHLQTRKKARHIQ